MNPIFGRGISLPSRLAIAILMSLVLMGVDHFSDGAAKFRTYLNTLVSPLFYVANLPHELIEWGAENVQSRGQLMAENQQLRENQLLQNEKLQQFDFLQSENDKLRALLGSAARGQAEKLVTQVLAVHSNPYSHQIVINKGLVNNVYEGQPVLDDLGLVGQVTQVGSTTSRVLLMTDTTHATPVRILRSGVRTIVEGVGKLNQVKLSHVPHSMDIRVGDMLVTSGLAGRFPEGYPVAVVDKVIRDESQPFAQVFAQPVAQLDRSRLLILLWNQADVKVDG